MAFTIPSAWRRMYNTRGKSFTQVLEELDPSASYEKHRVCRPGRLSAPAEAV